MAIKFDDEAPAKSKIKFDEPVSTPVPVPETKSAPKAEAPKKDFLGEVKEVGKAGGIGATLGAFSPEILTGLGLGAAAFPPTAPAAPFLLAGGQLARGARLGAAVTGGLGAAAGSAAGKMVPEPEKVEVDIPGVQLTRRQLAETAGEFAGPGVLKGAEMAVKGTPILGAAVRGLEKLVGLGESEFRKAAERQLATMRGSLPATFTEPYRKIYEALAGVDEQKRRAAISSLGDATKRAEAIIAHYNNQSNRVVQFNTQEAQRLKEKGFQEAQKVLDDAAADVERRAGIAERARVSGAQAQERGQQALASVGEAQTPTQIGTKIRESVMPLFEQLKQTRSANAEKLKGEAFSEALDKERAGQKISDTQAFKDALTTIKNALVNPETKLTNVSVDEVRNQLTKVKRALDPREVDPATGTVTGRPASFEALENLRRFLRDRAYGLPAEGFDAIGQQQAGRLADAVEAIQREFSPKIGKFLEQYKADSQPLNAFKTKLGQAIVGAEDFDMNRLVTDPAVLGEKFFKSETGVKDLINLMGGNVQQVEGIARSYIADKLRKASAKDVEKLLLSTRDWIGQFPALQQQLGSVAQQMGVSERIAAKRGKLSDVLRTDISKLPDIARQRSEQMRSQAETESLQRVQRGLTQAEQLRKTGQGLAKTAEAPVPKGVLTGKDPVAEIEGLITRGETEKLKQAAPSIQSSPELMRSFNQALDITLSRMNPANVLDDFERTIKPALLNTGLITPQKAQELSQRIRVVQMTLEPSQAAQTARWIIKTGISGEAGTQLTD